MVEQKGQKDQRTALVPRSEVLAKRETELTQAELLARAQEVSQAHWEYQAAQWLQVQRGDKAEDRPFRNEEAIADIKPIIENAYALKVRGSSELSNLREATKLFLQESKKGFGFNYDLVAKAVIVSADSWPERLSLYQELLGDIYENLSYQALPHLFVFSLMDGDLEAWQQALDSCSFQTVVDIPESFQLFSELSDVNILLKFAETRPVDDIFSIERKFFGEALSHVAPNLLADFAEKFNLPKKDSFWLWFAKDYQISKEQLKALESTTVFASLSAVEGNRYQKLAVAHNLNSLTLVTIDQHLNSEAKDRLEAAEATSLLVEYLDLVYESFKDLIELTQSKGIIVPSELFKVDEELRSIEKFLKEDCHIDLETARKINEQLAAIEQDLDTKSIFDLMDLLVGIRDYSLRLVDNLKIYGLTEKDCEILIISNLFPEMFYPDAIEDVLKKTSDPSARSEILSQVDQVLTPLRTLITERLGMTLYRAGRLKSIYGTQLEELASDNRVKLADLTLITANYENYQRHKNEFMKKYHLDESELGELRAALDILNFNLGFFREQDQANFEVSLAEFNQAIEVFTETLRINRQTEDYLSRHNLDRDSAAQISKSYQEFQAMEALPIGIKLRKALVLAESGDGSYLKRLVSEKSSTSLLQESLTHLNLEDFILIINSFDLNEPSQLEIVAKFFGKMNRDNIVRLANYLVALGEVDRQELLEQLKLLIDTAQMHQLDQEVYQDLFDYLSGKGCDNFTKEGASLPDQQVSRFIGIIACRVTPQQLPFNSYELERVSFLKLVARDLQEGTFKSAWAAYATELFSVGEAGYPAFSVEMIPILEQVGISLPGEDETRGVAISDSLVNYLQVLGLRIDQFTEDKVKNAYRRLARRFHPDVSQEEDAEEKFKQVNQAYEALKVALDLGEELKSLTEEKFAWWKVETDIDSYGEFRSSKAEKAWREGKIKQEKAQAMMVELKKIVPEVREQLSKLNDEHLDSLLDKVEEKTRDLTEESARQAIIEALIKEYKERLWYPVIDEALITLGDMSRELDGQGLSEEDKRQISAAIAFSDAILVKMRNE